jgi:NAD(P)-dependent dehydrogenase (short-subunit alcohol dehydrogenase family)
MFEVPGGNMTLNGRVAIITGASRGIGFAIAKRFHEAGAQVALCGRSTDDLKRHEEIMGRERALAAVMDIRDRGNVDGGIRRIVEKFGKIDIVVNNAGVSGVTPIDAEDSGPWLDIVQTNIVGAYHVTRASVKHMPERGRVINISSVLGKFGVPGYTAYCTAKTGIIGFTRALALELAPRKIAVNAICPGWVATEMAWSGMRDIAAAIGISAEEFKQQAMSRVPLGEMIEPSEVAELALFLASDAGKNMDQCSILNAQFLSESDEH